MERKYPMRIAKKLEEAYKAMKEPNFIKGMKDLHLPIRYRNSQELTEYLVYNYNYFAKLLKEMGLRGWGLGKVQKFLLIPLPILRIFTNIEGRRLG